MGRNIFRVAKIADLNRAIGAIVRAESNSLLASSAIAAR
jgi:hypothetical protein